MSDGKSLIMRLAGIRYALARLADWPDHAGERRGIRQAAMLVECL